MLQPTDSTEVSEAGVMREVRNRPLRILCISPLMAPIADAEAFCGAKMVQALMEAGSTVAVISSSDFRKDARRDSSVVWYSMRDVVLDMPQLATRNWLDSIAAAWGFQTPFYARWVSRVVCAAWHMHETAQFDFVYSRSLPMIAHVAGFWCARQLRVPWVANINDPWELEFFPGADMEETSSSLSRRSKLLWLGRTLRKADLVTYPCSGLQQFHAELSGLEHRAEIIPHIGYTAKGTVAKAPATHFRMVHAGKLGTNEITQRSAKALLLGLRAFLDASPDAASHTKLVLVGPEDHATQAFARDLQLMSNIEQTSTVSYEASIELIQSASVCILIETNQRESIFFPSKLADYIVCGKPVLALSPPVGFVADLARSGELLRVDHDPDAVHKAISMLYGEFQAGTLKSRRPTDRLIREFSACTVADQFLEACRPILYGGV
jgi:hypothetical protein